MIIRRYHRPFEYHRLGYYTDGVMRVIFKWYDINLHYINESDFY